jgi:hypothetical protein
MTTSLAWSYSSLQAFETCPWRFYLTRVSKQVTEPQSPALAEGNAVHKALELHIKGQQWLPEKYARLVPLAERVKAEPGAVTAERTFALNQAFQEVRYFAPDVWVRGKIDVEIVRPNEAILIDWKDGKQKEDIDQLELFAAAGFKLHPHVQKIDVAYVWLKARAVDKQTFVREQAQDIWKKFSIRAQRMEHARAENNYPKRPSGLCREWCPVGKKLCEHCGK